MAMFEDFRSWEFFSVRELPVIMQEGKPKGLLISINQVRALLKKIEELEIQVMYLTKEFLDSPENLGLDEDKGKKRFIPW